MVAILHYRKSKFCKGHTFSNAVKIMILISDVQIFIPKNYAKLHAKNRKHKAK